MNVGVGNLLEMKRGEVVFVVHFVKGKMLEACVVVGCILEGWWLHLLLLLWNFGNHL